MQFITGNKFKKICDYIFDENGFLKTEVKNTIPIYFVKTDLIHTFFNYHRPTQKFKLITHNSDYSIDIKFKNYLEDPNITCWFGQNINYVHPKLVSIPIGIANEIWKHGDEKILTEIIDNGNQKNNLIYCNFDITTNFTERNNCNQNMVKNGIIMDQKQNYKDYLTKLSKSFFSISPNGNGIDCHKLWESLYLKTIPVVTKSINVDFYKNLPIYVINSWDNFDITKINMELYYEFIEKYNSEFISMDYYRNKILNF